MLDPLPSEARAEGGIEGVQALEFTGRAHPLLLWGLLATVAMAPAQDGTKFPA